jgi:tRNA(Ile2) C34 agmatinyltransferase TiaS
VSKIGGGSTAEMRCPVCGACAWVRVPGDLEYRCRDCGIPMGEAVLRAAFGGLGA